MPCGVDPKRVVPSDQGEVHFRAVAFTDPVGLHRQDAFGPIPCKFPAPFEQLFRVIRDLVEPLGQFLLHDLLVASPAKSGFDLFVGQNRLARFAPVDETLLTIREALFVHLEENPLVPFVVVRFAGGDFLGPVVAVAEFFELRPHKVDVLESPLSRMDVLFDGRVFSRHAEGVPAHGVKNIEPAHPPETGHDVSDAVITNVPDVYSARRVREHLKNIVFWTVVFRDLEYLAVLPLILPLGLDLIRMIAVFHEYSPKH